jgi:outer membrane protein OmpA-like peptidoglycan-associated protein
MRNQLITVLFLLCFQPIVSAQSEWALQVSVEETVTLGDARSSFHFLSFTQLAANSGMRSGFHYTKDHHLAAELTLGVVGTSRPNSWFTKIVPVEFVGHYNILPHITGDSPFKFNLDLGVGSALVRARSVTYNTNGRFSFSEHIAAGASLDIPFYDLGTLSFGFRNTYFIDDYIDATPVDETNNDQLLRFFTSARVNLGQSAKTKTIIADAEEKAAKLNSELALAKANAELMTQKNSSTVTKLEKSIASLEEKLVEAGNTPRKEYILQSVHFEINRSVIRNMDIPELTTLLNLLSTNDNLNAVIIGHTDDLGPEEFNLKLSIERALAVKNWLVDRGIAEGRLEVKGESNTYPVLPNSEDDARAINRRTEIILKQAIR